MFMVSEHQSGYLCGFSVYTWKGSNELLSQNSTLDPDCTITTKTVMGLLEKTKLLDKHRTFFFDNYFNSPEALDELRYRDCYGCGTICGHCKGLPKAVVSKKIKLKKGEAVFQRKGYLRCMKWQDKRPVCMLSSHHAAVQCKVKNNYLEQPVIKPVIIQDYNQKMGSVDQTDNFLANYQTLKSIKWYKKLLLHLNNMVVLNSYILNKKFGVNKLTHTGYRKYIANYLITMSMDSSLLLPKTPQSTIENPEA